MRTIITILVFLLAWSGTAEAKCYKRSQRATERAIRIVAPQLNKKLRRVYAQHIRRAAHKHCIDPLTLVSMFWHESGFRSRVKGDAGEAHGLGQIHARYLPGCDSKKKATQDNSKSCKAVKARLLNPIFNINQTARTIAATRKACRRMTKRPALFHRWLAAYGGAKGICGQVKRRKRWRDLPQQHKGVKEIIRCRKDLIRSRRCKRTSLKKRRVKRRAKRPTSASRSRSQKRRGTMRSKRVRSSTRKRRASRSRRTR